MPPTRHKPFPKTDAERLRTIRYLLDMTQEQFAVALGCGGLTPLYRAQKVSRFECSRRPVPATIMHLAETLLDNHVMKRQLASFMADERDS